MNNYVYIIEGLKDNKKKHYIGYTNNPSKRIRQHNGEISGGAKATRGYKWKFIGIISNIKDNIEALQIEWRLKHATKKRDVISRINAFLDYLEENNNASAIKNMGTEFEKNNHILMLDLEKIVYEKCNIHKEWKNIIINPCSISDNMISYI